MPPFAPFLERLRNSLPAAVIQRFLQAGVPDLAAALAFYTLLSLAPLLVLLLWLTASLYPPAQASLVAQIGDLAGPAAAEVARTVLANAQAQPDIGSLAGVISTGGLLFGATLVFAQLQGALNRIFHSEQARFDGALGWIKQRMFSAGVVLALGFLLIVAMVATTAVQVAFAQLPSLLPAIVSLTTLAVYAAAFACLYHWVPDRQVPWRQAWLGGAITAVLFTIGRHAIGLYLANAAPGSAYGSMGALVLLLVWIYYACLVFFAGAMITAVIDERTRAEPAPAAVAG
ncbi:YihY/virulence factor BrkB family protein [Stenotrophomonas sp. W1S232]|uniref:YihY/virulence factor BrkB family protein n=1 Tax=Stenotrophomonas koreensis TaxID=266128 RepID=A0A7W3V2U8_9GAMM|nr:YihY/virulence factor BrkB family protein [Stenotrophomonas koreensis]MBB1118047.1 YihY/virulence factor BrkB family protein [Stenotrophomonas koreensis]